MRGRGIAMTTQIVVLMAALVVGSSSLALADTPGQDWMTIDQVAKKLQESGYSPISKIEADDGHREGEGMKDGKKMEFHADARTGAILSEKPD
jgi:hypothetical protein